MQKGRALRQTGGMLSRIHLRKEAFNDIFHLSIRKGRAFPVQKGWTLRQTGGMLSRIQLRKAAVNDACHMSKGLGI